MEEEPVVGMSRAAKKRAKKKKRQMDDSQETEQSVPPQRQPKKSCLAKRSKIGTNGEKTTAKDDGSADRNDTNRIPKPVQPTISCATLKEIVLCDHGEVGTTENAAVAELTSPQRARCALQHILRTVGVDHFYKDHWEQKPLWIQCSSDEERRRFDGFLSSDQMRDITATRQLRNGVDFNVTRYEKTASTGQYSRVTLDVNSAEKVWEAYDAHGATIRWLRPQEHVPAVHALLSLLELEWGCMVGANAYLTPKGTSQGFAPHYDDIEALLLQLEGRKRWRVYAPLETATTLPRVSSEDYKREQLLEQKPVLDITLERGDALFLPRGWIHEAVTTPDSASLHLTVSTMQQWAWADLLELVIPEALEASIQSQDKTLLREGLPLRFLDYMGVVHDDSNVPDILNKKDIIEDDDEHKEEKLAAKEDKSRLQEAFRTGARKRIMFVAKEAVSMLDAACDQLGKRFLSERLPPALVEKEKPTAKEIILPTTLCRLARAGIARLVLEDDKAIVYHCADNSVVYQAVPISPLEYEMDHAPALEQLVTTVAPYWIEVSELHHDSIEDKVALAKSLYDEGILQLRN